MVLTKDDMTAVLYAYNFVLNRMGEPVAVDLAAEALRARHRGLDKTAAQNEVLRLIAAAKRLSAGRKRATARG